MLEWLPSQRLPNRLVVAGVDSVFDEMCSTNVMVISGKYGPVFVQQFANLVPLLIGEFFLKIRHHLFDHIIFCFSLVDSINGRGCIGAASCTFPRQVPRANRSSSVRALRMRISNSDVSIGTIVRAI